MAKIIDFITATSIADNDYIAMADSSGNTRKVTKSTVAPLVNDLTTGGTTKYLSAEQGKVAKGLIDANTSDINTLKDKVNQTSLTNIEINTSPITSLTGMLNGFVDSLLFKGKTKYKSGSTYTDTYSSGVSLESVGESEGKITMTSLKSTNAVGDTLNISLAKPLRGLGSIVDTLDVTSKTITRNVGQITFKGDTTENWVLGAPPLTTNTLQFKIQIADGKTGLSPTAINLMCDKFQSDTSANNISNDSESIAFDDNGYVLVRILKSKLATQNVAGFKLWLASVNTTIVYQLLNSVSETIKKVGTLQTFANGYLQLNNVIVPTINFNYPVMLASVVAEHTKLIDDLEDVVVDNTNKIGDLTTLTTTDKTSLVNAIKENTTSLSDRAKLVNTPQQTTVAINYYVSPSGLDTNDGLTSGTAVKTIAKAISLLPQVVNHIININILAGTYNESIVLSGFMGNGTINIVGASVLSDSYLVNNIQVNRCSLPITITGIKCTSSTLDSISISFCSAVILNYVKSDVTATSVNGLLASYSKVKISNSLLSNKGYSITSISNSNVYSENNSGTGNTVGLQAIYNGEIGKSGTQPTGTTAEVSNSGGLINPPTPPTEITVTTRNGFTTATGSKATYYKEQDSIVTVNVFLNNTSNVSTNIVMCSLPTGYRPNEIVRSRGLVTSSGAIKFCEVYISANGDIWVNGIQDGISTYTNVQFDASFVATN